MGLWPGRKVSLQSYFVTSANALIISVASCLGDVSLMSMRSCYLSN